MKIRVSGTVQGVGFRYFTFRTARRLSLSGYVRNNSDGSVEVVAEGDRSNLLTLVEELRIVLRGHMSRVLASNGRIRRGNSTASG